MWCQGHALCCQGRWNWSMWNYTRVKFHYIYNNVNFTLYLYTACNETTQEDLVPSDDLTLDQSPPQVNPAPVGPSLPQDTLTTLVYKQTYGYSVIYPFVMSLAALCVATATLIKSIILRCICRRRNRDPEDSYEPVGREYWQQLFEDGTIREIPTISKPLPPLPLEQPPKYKPIEGVYAYGCPCDDESGDKEVNKQYACVNSIPVKKEKQYARVNRSIQTPSNYCVDVETVGKQYARVHRTNITQPLEGVIKQEIS